jgi:hypothetical protein
MKLPRKTGQFQIIRADLFHSKIRSTLYKKVEFLIIFTYLCHSLINLLELAQ